MAPRSSLGPNLLEIFELVPAGANHIVRILLGRSRIKMIRVHAEDIVAGVTCEKACRDRAFVQFYGDTVCTTTLSLDIDYRVLAPPLSHQRAEPKPAS
jgi:hypothetical protein